MKRWVEEMGEDEKRVKMRHAGEMRREVKRGDERRREEGRRTGRSKEQRDSMTTALVV